MKLSLTGLTALYTAGFQRKTKSSFVEKWKPLSGKQGPTCNHQASAALVYRPCSAATNLRWYCCKQISEAGHLRFLCCFGNYPDHSGAHSASWRPLQIERPHQVSTGAHPVASGDRQGSVIAGFAAYSLTESSSWLQLERQSQHATQVHCCTC